MRSGVRRLAARLRTSRDRRLAEATPRRRVCDLAGANRATVVGTVTEVAGDGPALRTWVQIEGEGPPVSGRETRPFGLDDGTGVVRVRVPPDSGVLVGAGGEQTAVGARTTAQIVVGEGDRVSVSGRVRRGRGGTRILTGPRCVVTPPP
ncbi:hypothetical protein AUR66_11390 [Haloferax profundi]|uniref:Uncharacterized protein n=1 Tax=Haloferax profundi TaxID=1544718 RepID=A0A0W1SRL9_9EURY|nr:hypothetical protein AUR66_11390 [Haloferax profundi]